MVPYTAVRDLLHEHFPESQNKTSRACQRRLNYMLKNQVSWGVTYCLTNYQIFTLIQSTADNVALFLEDVKQDGDIVTQFNIPEAGAISRIELSTKFRESFHSRHSV